MREIIECVPNFSTSDPVVVESILNEIKRVEGAYLLDHTYDSYYNRLVVSYIGNTTAVYTSASKIDRSTSARAHVGLSPTSKLG